MNLVPLFEEALEFQDYNGTVLSDGKVAVYYIGRTRLADIYTDVEGSVPAENPRILNNLGMGPVYVNPAFDYEMVVFDTYGSELFSVKKYLASKGEHSTANVVVTPSESIAVSAWTIGDVQVYMPYLTGQLGKVYTGIDPIVVNNVEDKISANHVPLGVQDPLYFVQDDEEGCIIGFSGETLPEGTMNESAFGYQDGQITSYNGSAFSAGNSYEAGSYVDIDGNTINVTGLQPAGNYQSAGDYVVHDELSSYATQDWVENQSYMKEYMESAFYPSTSNPSGYLTEHQSLDGLMSADLLEISDNKITGYNGTAFAGQGGVTGDYELVAGSGVELVDDPDAHTTTINVTAQGGNPEVEQAVIDNSANWDSVTSKADVTAIPSLEGYATEDWVTGQGYITNDAITGKQDITGMTAYQPAGDYLTTGDSANFATTGDIEDLVSAISETYQPITGMTAYQPAGDYLSSNALDNVSGDWNEVSAKLDTTAFSNVSGSFLTTVPDTYLQNTDLSTTDGKVTAISGIPLSAGGNVAVYTDAALPNSTQLDADIAAGKAICIVYDGRNYWFDRKSSDYYFYGADAYSTYLYYLFFRPGNNSWSRGQKILATQSWVTAEMSSYANSASVTGTAQYGLTTAGWSEITAGGDVPAGTMNESGLEYDASGNISAYSGSAFAAQLPEEEEVEFEEIDISSISAASDYISANSANIDATVTNVSANSGAWGGSALPISAGPGIKFEMVNDTLVFSNDETVLFETTSKWGTGSLNLSESLKNFDKIGVLAVRGYSSNSDQSVNGGCGQWCYFATDYISARANDFHSITPYIFEGYNWKNSCYSANDTFTTLTWYRGIYKDMSTTAAGVTANAYTGAVGIRKVIGINRKQ